MTPDEPGDEARFVRPYVPPVSAAPVSAAPVSPALPDPAHAPPKPPTFRRRTVRATARVPAGAAVSGVPAEPASRRRVVGAVVALAVVAAGLTAYIARPRHQAPVTAAAQPTDLYLPTAGDPTGVAGTQIAASQRTRPSPTASGSATHTASASARPPTLIAGPAVPTAPSPTANPLGVNLAVGKPTATSSTEANGWDAKYAVDGDTGTRWSSQWSDPQWIRVDLGGLWSVSRVTLRWETAYGTRYSVRTSTDGTAWTTVRTVDNGDGGVDDVSFPPVAARYVMMFGTRRSGGYGYSLWEFEVR